MAVNTPTPLEDPQLKAALKSALGDHRASDQLRQRVKAAMASAGSGQDASTAAPTPASTLATSSEPSGPIPFPRSIRRARWVLGLAAMVALAAGVLFITVNRSVEEDPNYHLLDEMVDAHKDWDAKSAEIEIIAPLAEMPIPLADNDGSRTKLAGVLKGRLNRSVPVPDFKSEGWELSAVAVQQVDGKAAAHFVLSKGTQRVSVFSMAASSLAKPFPGGIYQVKIDEFPMAGVVKGDGLHCVIGPPEMKLEDAVRLRDLLVKSQMAS